MISCAARLAAPSAAIAWLASPIVYIVTMLFEDSANPADSTGMDSCAFGGLTKSPGTSRLSFTSLRSRRAQARMVEMEEEAAAPVTPHPNWKMNRQSSAQFNTFATTVVYRIVRVSFSPRKAPMQTSCMSVACTEKTRASRYFIELVTTRSELVKTFLRNHSAPAYLRRKSSEPMEKASQRPVQMVRETAWASPRALAPETRGVMAVARNWKSATVNVAQMRPARPVPASSFTPMRPMMAVSTIDISGSISTAKSAGRASLTISPSKGDAVKNSARPRRSRAPRDGEASDVVASSVLFSAPPPLGTSPPISLSSAAAQRAPAPHFPALPNSE
mmetsp:Transcript_4757/g.12079  ORF Transcript_4757/g.12079 Transcript_4757/m.12079 type:complete len:332 (+) Transcript_4757:158-1153(+)